MPIAAYEHALHPEQLRVVLEGDGPCLVLAGAGSGKTRTITYRVAWLLEQGVPGESILLLTFTNKAAKEMLERVVSVSGANAHAVWSGTFHSIANRILRGAAHLLGYTPSFTILDSDDAKAMLKTCVKDMGDGGHLLPTPAVIADVLSYARNAQVTMAEALDRKQPKFADKEPLFLSIAERYAERKRAANSMDFDDLLTNFLRLLNENPSAASALQEQFRYVLVDEYQDTNPVQASIIDRLAAKHRNILVVGDDAQSIYSFRAATIENIMTFPERFSGAKVFRLESNYRSTPEILAVANNVISQNLRQFQKTLQPIRQSFCKPVLITSRSAYEEADTVAQAIEKISANGISPSKMAVLFRATHHSQELEFALTKRGIPYEYRGGLKFFERAHVKDVIACLRLQVNPKDITAWLRLLLLQEGIGDAGATKLAEKLSTLDSLHDLTDAFVADVLPARSRAGWQVARELLDAASGAKKPAEAIRQVAHSSYAVYLAREYPNAEDRLEDLEHFANFAAKYESLSAFLAEVTLNDEVGRAPGAQRSSEPRVILSTIHQAKGLEWDIVFIIRMAHGSFPHSRSFEDETQLEEERRLFYVAVTRAREQLFLSYPQTQGYDANFLMPSQFLDEIDEKLIDRSKRPETPAPAARSFSTWPTRQNAYATPQRSKTVFLDETESSEEDTIELDALGEPKKPAPRRSSFLRSVDEL